MPYYSHWKINVKNELNTSLRAYAVLWLPQSSMLLFFITGPSKKKKKRNLNCRGVMFLLTHSLQQIIVCYHTEDSRETLEHQNLPNCSQASCSPSGTRTNTSHRFSSSKKTILGRWFKYYSYSFPSKTRTISFSRHKHRWPKWSLLGRGKSYPEDIQEKKVLTHQCQTICPIPPLSSQRSCIIFCCSHYKHFLSNMGSMSLQSHMQVLWPNQVFYSITKEAKEKKKEVYKEWIITIILWFLSKWENQCHRAS